MQQTLIDLWRPRNSPIPGHGALGRGGGAMVAVQAQGMPADQKKKHIGPVRETRPTPNHRKPGRGRAPGKQRAACRRAATLAAISAPGGLLALGSVPSAPGAAGGGPRWRRPRGEVEVWVPEGGYFQPRARSCRWPAPAAGLSLWLSCLPFSCLAVLWPSRCAVFPMAPRLARLTAD